MSHDAPLHADRPFSEIAKGAAGRSTQPSWIRSILLIAIASYLPFVALAGYMTAFVSCSHCRLTAWQLAPVGPGLVPMHVALQFSGIGRLADDWEWTIAALTALSIIAVMAFVSRLGRLWQGATLAIAFACCSLFACVLYALIRA